MQRRKGKKIHVVHFKEKKQNQSFIKKKVLKSLLSASWLNSSSKPSPRFLKKQKLWSFNFVLRVDVSWHVFSRAAEQLRGPPSRPWSRLGGGCCSNSAVLNVIADAPLVLTGQSNGAVRASWRRYRPCFSTSPLLDVKETWRFHCFCFVGGAGWRGAENAGRWKGEAGCCRLSEPVRSRQRASQSDFKVAVGRGDDPEPSLQLAATGHSCLRVRPRPPHTRRLADFVLRQKLLQPVEPHMWRPAQWTLEDWAGLFPSTASVI